jgi:hypothetical protein
LSLPSNVDLSRMPSFDPRETNPFRYVFLAGLGRAKDPAQAKAALEAAKKFDKQLGADIQSSQVGGDPVYTFKYALGEGASIALEGEQVVVSGGEGRLAPLLGRLHAASPGPALPPDEASRLAQAGSFVYLDLSRVVERVRALPASAFGLGGFAIRAALMRWMDALDDLHRLTVTADARSGLLHAELRMALP